MNVTPEARKERLRGLAKARVAQLVGNSPASLTNVNEARTPEPVVANVSGWNRDYPVESHLKWLMDGSTAAHFSSRMPSCSKPSAMRVKSAILWLFP